MGDTDMHTMPSGTDTPQSPVDAGRTAYQQTLLGDDPGSRIAWTLYMDGYQRGVASGYDAGYDAAMRVLDEAGALLASYKVWQHPTQAELAERRKVRGDNADHRTGEELRADAHASWAALDTPGRQDIAA